VNKKGVQGFDTLPHDYLVGGFKHEFHFPFHKKGMESSFPLTFTPSFFKMGTLHHQPAMYVAFFLVHLKFWSRSGRPR